MWRSRIAWFTGFLASGLLVEAGVIAAVDSDRFQERYLIALVPLVPLAFGLYLRQGAPHKRIVSAIAVAMLLFSVRVPLSGYAAAGGKDDSSLLRGIRQLGQWVGVADGALVVALAAALLSLAAVALALRPRAAAAGGIVLTALAFGSLSIGTYAYDRSLAASVRTDWLPPDVQWVDHSGVRDAALLMLPNSERQRSWHQLIWNRSVGDVLLVGKGTRLDGYASSRVRIADDGRILDAGRTVRRPLLVQTYGSQADFTGATKMATVTDFELWRPQGVPRLSLLADGWYGDGWVAWPGSVTVWPDASGRVDGTLVLRVGVPDGFAPTRLTLEASGFARTIPLAPGAAVTIRIPVSQARRWKLQLSTPRAATVGLRVVSVRGLRPVFERRGTTPARIPARGEAVQMLAARSISPDGAFRRRRRRCGACGLGDRVPARDGGRLGAAARQGALPARQALRRGA